MALDYLAFERIISLIKNDINNGKIVKISQLSNEEFLFIIRNNNQNYNLLISTHPNMSYLNIVDKKPESNHINTNLLMLLRKHLENGRILNFTQQNNDRIVLMEVINRDDYFNNTVHKLYIELIGRASNIILTNNTNIIVDSLKKIPLQYLNIRTIQPGITYVLPEKPLNEKNLYELENEMNYLDVSFEKIKEKIKNSSNIYITTIKDKKYFHFIPLHYLNGNIEEYKWNQGLDVFYSDSLVYERHRQFCFEIEKLVKNQIKRNELKVKKLSTELETAKGAIIYKYYGDLLLTYLQGKKIDKDIVNIYDEQTMEYISIPYDLRYDLYYNANNYYKKYRKSKVALVKIAEQMNLCLENIDYFKTIKYQLEKADYTIAMQIKEELTELGYFNNLKNNVKNKKSNKKQGKVYKPLTIKFEDTLIYVGMNNLQNEYLTFKIADKSFMFFHVQQGPGAHVVVASNNINDKLKFMAANIAAYYSSFSNSSTVAVNYTLVKNIKKIPGGKPGKVIINNQKTIYVDPDYLLFKDFILR